MSWLMRLLKLSVDRQTITADIGVKHLVWGGSVSTPVTLNTADDRGVYLWFSSTATSGTTYGVYVGLLGNGAGSEQIAMRSKTLLATNSIGNAHGHHATLELDTTSGSVTGLGTGLRGNLVVGDRAIANGTYYGVLAEIYALGNSAAVPAGSNACLGLNIQPGTAMDLVGNFISFSGTDGSTKGIYTHNPGNTFSGSIKILVNGAKKWLYFAAAE